MIPHVWEPDDPVTYTTTGTAPHKPSDLLVIIYCSNGEIKEKYMTVKEYAIEEIIYQPFY